MNENKQKLLIEYTISSPDVFALCSSIMHPEYFDPELRNAVTFIQDYYEEYNTVPDVEQIKAETDIELTHQEVKRDKIDYCSTEIEKFCKRRAIEKAIYSSPDLIDIGDYGQIETMLKDALTVSLHHDLGIDFFEDVKVRLEQRDEDEVNYSSGWNEYDELMNGFQRRTFTIFMANSGGGKSVALANAGLNLMEQGLNVLYLSLELYQDMVDDRIIMMMTGKSKQEFAQHATEIDHTITKAKDQNGNLTIKYMPSGSTPNDIRAYMKEFELRNGFVPDVLLLDYLDITSPNEHVSADNVFEKDKRTSEQVRNILVDYNMIGISASQQNRGGVDQDRITQAHIAGGISKINTVDNVISIIMSDAQRAKGEMAFQFVKTRSSEGVGNTIYLKWNRKALRIENLDGQKPSLNIADYTKDPKDEDGKSSLIDLIGT